MTYHLSVRGLCEFSAKRGSLDLRFTPSPSSAQGIAGHQRVADSRPCGYQKELPLKGHYRQLTIAGRADGYDADSKTLEEIKTHRGDLERQPDNHRQLHWAQVKIYGHLLCQEYGLDEVRLALVYLDIDTGRETHLYEQATAAQLGDFFAHCCQHFLDWAQRELDHRQKRDLWLKDLVFPHDRFRPGQRDLAEAVYKTLATKRVLMAQAATGIGKTQATLFPALKALARGGLDKLFFLTAKTPGRTVALTALSLLRDTGATSHLRVLELSARDKACEHPDLACHGDSCPLADGFYDRLSDARSEAAKTAWLDKEALKRIAAAHRICPYYLAQEMVRWCDLVVADYNYYFDSSALLHGLTLREGWQISILVDEAHNLIDRARSMYSATLRQAQLIQAWRPLSSPTAKPVLRLHRAWNKLNREIADAQYSVLEAIPQRLIAALKATVSDIGEALVDNPEMLSREQRQFYFACLEFNQLAEQIGEDFIVDITREETAGHQRTTIAIRNVVPARLLEPRFSAASSSVLFSATLSPGHFYRDMLGLTEEPVSMDIPSPFNPDNLRVSVVPLSTRYRHRNTTAAAIAEEIARQFYRCPGNYLAFFSSFAYLELIAEKLSGIDPKIPRWLQTRHMSEVDRGGFLDNFREGGKGIGLAVLGGAFGEGIDLPGDRLIGTFIATLGLAQFNPVNEQFRARIDRLLGRGYEYTYLFPGLQKVTQAAGRVIRRAEDQGQVFLIDNRYLQPRVRNVLPATWFDPLTTEN